MFLQIITAELVQPGGLNMEDTLDNESQDQTSNNKSNETSWRGPCFDEKAKSRKTIPKP